MQRLVYNPKSWVFIKRRNGDVVDVSKYVTAGSVQRRVNAVSSATVTMRNTNMLFTTGRGKHAAFFPQDPITIYLQRLKNRPVRVFTGFLDETPYIELFPGTIELSASCTLKKLLYTYFDPALPYTESFLATYGWYPQQDGSFINAQAQTGINKQQDGGMGSLLFATLRDIGGWDQKNIKIEKLPDDLIKRMTNLFRTFNQDEIEARAELETMLQNFVGNGSYGSSGGSASGADNSTGDIKGIENIIPVMVKIANQFNVPAEMVIATGLIETGLTNHDSPGNPHYGWFQWDSKSGPPGSYVGWGYHGSKPNGCYDLGFATTGYCTAAAGAAKIRPSFKNDTLGWTMAIQGVNGTNNPLYPQTWSSKIAQAKSLMNKYGSASSSNTALSDAQNKSSSVTKQALNNNKALGSGQTTRFDAIVAEANRMTQLANNGLRYNNARPPSDTQGYDCSSSCTALLKAAGYNIPGWPTTATIKQYLVPGVDPTGRFTLYDNDRNNAGGNNVHIFAQINGKNWTTAGGLSAHFVEGYHGATPDFQPFHVDGLDDPHDVPANANTSTTGGNTDTTTQSDQMLSRANATLLATTLNWASYEEQQEAIALRGNKSLMNDKPLMPFIQQMTEGSLRQFMSMPNGDFFGFYPDYFGETFHRPPYWIIDDIEILEGRVRLSDASLITHEYVVGDTTWTGQGGLPNMLLSAGAVSIVNAFVSDLTATRASKKANDGNTKDKALYTAFNRILKQDEAIQFLQRYGARPNLEMDYPFIRSPFYELFLAYQHFMQGWARQFLTPFEFTFMPELYPGGKVGMPEHGLQMYIEEVTHSWDYASGFTTNADLSSPAAMVDSNGNVLNPDLPDNIPTALLEMNSA